MGQRYNVFFIFPNKTDIFGNSPALNTLESCEINVTNGVDIIYFS